MNFFHSKYLVGAILLFEGAMAGRPTGPNGECEKSNLPKKKTEERAKAATTKPVETAKPPNKGKDRGMPERNNPGGCIIC